MNFSKLISISDSHIINFLNNNNLSNLISYYNHIKTYPVYLHLGIIILSHLLSNILNNIFILILLFDSLILSIVLFNNNYKSKSSTNIRLAKNIFIIFLSFINIVSFPIIIFIFILLHSKNTYFHYMLFITLNNILNIFFSYFPFLQKFYNIKYLS